MTGSGNKVTNLNINPNWLQEVLDIKYISIRDVARAIGANPEGFERYIRRKGIEPVFRNLSSRGHLILCVTEEQAKKIVRHRLREGYLVSKPINRENGNGQQQ
ncbi:MAG: hypothetical protein AMS17_01040 [Spirochaetes bacterium DG_61]|nr:MAG: hypothetical protein AMS17_01040 [Spirochaetes bacterium DG_61]